MLGTQKSLIQTQVEAPQISGLQQHNLLVLSPYSTGRFRPKADAAVGAITSSGLNHLDTLEMQGEGLEVAIWFVLSDSERELPENRVR